MDRRWIVANVAVWLPLLGYCPGGALSLNQSTQRKCSRSCSQTPTVRRVWTGLIGARWDSIRAQSEFLSVNSRHLRT